MRQAGRRVWYAPEEMNGSEKLHEQIDRAIQVHDRLLLVLSEDSLSSEWVATEIRRARKAERREGRKKLFPIRLVAMDPPIKERECFDADGGRDLVGLREYFIPDFGDWKEHDVFEASFARLLRDMHAGGGEGSLRSGLLPGFLQTADETTREKLKRKESLQNAFRRHS